MDLPRDKDLTKADISEGGEQDGPSSLEDQAVCILSDKPQCAPIIFIPHIQKRSGKTTMGKPSKHSGTNVEAYFMVCV